MGTKHEKLDHNESVSKNNKYSQILFVVSMRTSTLYVFNHSSCCRKCLKGIRHQCDCCPLSIFTCSVVLHASTQKHVRRAAKAEGGISLEGVVFFRSLGNLNATFEQVARFFYELIS